MADEVIDKKMRKTIKTMARVAQTARFVSLIPKPADFGRRLVGDIVYLSSLVQKVVSDISKVLDGYANVPYDYLNTQLNSISESMNSVVNKAEVYTNYFIDSSMEVTTGDIEITSASIDVAVDITKGVSGLGKKVSDNVSKMGTSSKASVAGDVSNAVSDSSNSVSDKLNNVAKAITKAQTSATGAVCGVVGSVTGTVNKGQEFVQNIIDKIKTAVDKLSDELDSGFGQISGLSKNSALYQSLQNIDSNSKTITQKSDSDKVVVAASAAIQKIIDEFSIGKCVKVFAGVVASAVLVKTGLNELPPINIEKMLSDFQGKQFGAPGGVSFDDLVEYDPSTYNELKKSFEIYLQEQRNETRKKKQNVISAASSPEKEYLKASQRFYKNMSAEERKNMKSAIKEINKKRKQTKDAKKADKFKDILLDELENLKKECKKMSKRLVDDWTKAMNNYKETIEQIKTFFEDGGDGDVTIENYCMDINDNCNTIKDLCTTKIPPQSANSSIKVSLPACIGVCYTNFAYSVVAFIIDVKTILKFIMDIMKCVLNIMNDVKQLMHIILCGLKDLKDIVNQLLGVLNLGWLKSMVNSLVNLASNNINNATDLIENSLTPVYLTQTDAYNTMVEQFDKLINNKINETEYKFDRTTDISSNYNEYKKKFEGGDYVNTFNTYAANNEMLRYEYFMYYVNTEDGTNYIRNYDNNIYLGQTISGNSADARLRSMKNIFISYAKDRIAAYKSPRFEAVTNTDDNNNIKIGNDVFKNVDIEKDVGAIKGWVYFHPDLYHLMPFDENFYIKDSGDRIIKDAVQKCKTMNGGVAQLKKNTDSSYIINDDNRKTLEDIRDENEFGSFTEIKDYCAFYWKYIPTNDITGDAYGPNDSVDNIITTSSGSVVKININSGDSYVFVKDEHVQSGDYVVVDGQTYLITKNGKLI